ncbi:MAG: hypothetical protein KAT43_05565 [Nanoarchaeota archaeon]|nr:hypothetical protein [Nanoarchaeota archaeon]
MTYEVTLKIDEPEKIRILKTEFESLEKQRFTIKTKKDTVEITAEDATALKAILNSVCKVLIVYEKMRQIK